MEWFHGSVAEAVQETIKKRGCLFVFIFDGTPTSDSLESSLLQSSIPLHGRAGRAIPLKIGALSQDRNHFQQFVRVTEVPSLFWVSYSGQLLESVGGDADRCAIDEKMQKAIGKLAVPTASASAASTIPSSSIAAPAAPPENTNAPPPSNTAPPPATTSASPPPLEDRIARAREIIRKQKEERERKLAAEKRESERERREIGKAVEEQRRERANNEIREAAEEQRKERLEKKAERIRLRQRIEADRAERQQAPTITAPLPTPEDEETAADAARRAAIERNRPSVTHILFRLPDGSKHQASFPVETTLSDACECLIPLVGPTFRLAISFPRRQLDDEEERQQTLAQLELVPSGTIIVKVAGVPSGGAPSNQVSTFSPMTVLYGAWAMFSTFLRTLYDFFSGLLPGNAVAATTTPGRAPVARTPATATQSSSGGQSSTTAAQREAMSQRWQQWGTTTGRHDDERKDDNKSEERGERASDESNFRVRRRGNMHSMVNPDDDVDNDEATWNGNSTQQL